MAKVCTICVKIPTTSNSRSHSNIASKRRHDINLQWTIHEGRRAMVCTRCLRTKVRKPYKANG